MCYFLFELFVDLFFFFFNDTATTEIYTLSLHDALPIADHHDRAFFKLRHPGHDRRRSEEHTSELQSPCNLVCRLLLEKKKKIINISNLIKKKKRQHNQQNKSMKN